MDEKILRESIKTEIRKVLKEGPYGSGLGGSERQKVSLAMLKTDIEKAQAIAKFADLVGLPMSKVAQLRSQLVRMKQAAKRGGDKEV